MRAVAAFSLALLAGCQAAPEGGPGSSASGSASSAPALVPTPSATAAPAGSVAPPVAALPSPPTITMACCTMDVAEGQFGTRGVVTRYSGDYLRRKDGERLLFPQDLINDTKELFQHAKSAGRSVTQERRVRAIGEGARWISVEIEDHGETGAQLPFVHSACKTLDLRTGRVQKLDEVVGKDVAARVIADANARFAALPGHEDYRFLASSFALVGAGKIVRFCNPRRREELGSARMDVEVGVGD